MDGKPVALIGQLKHLIETLDELNALLKSDRQHFSENNLALVQQSDDKKQKMLEKITRTIAELQKSLPNTREHLLDGLRAQSKQFHLSHQPTIDHLIDLLQSRLSDGYENVIANNHIVIMNLNYLKVLWDKLFKLSPEHNAVYEKPHTQPR